MTKLKLLYVSSWHGTLEYDDLKLFTEMGIDWFSTGYYANPRQPMETKFRYNKPPIDKDVDLDILNMFKSCNPHTQPHSHVSFNMWLLNQFDAIMVVDCAPNPEILINNLSLFKAAGKPVIWRTYGQQQTHAEYNIKKAKSQQDIKIVRGSNKESLIEYYAGEDYLIRPYVDENKFCRYHGSESYILTFNNFYNQRSWVSNTAEYEKVIAGLPAKLYGDSSEGAPNYGGLISEQEQIEKYRECYAYFALGSKPAFMTYNMIEAMMVGCPVLTWENKLGGEAFEGPDLFENGKDCIMSDDLKALRYHLWNPSLTKQLNGREAAIKVFGKEIARKNWTNLFKDLGY